MKYSVLPEACAKQMRALEGQSFVYATMGVLCLLVLGGYALFTGDGFVWGVLLFLFFALLAWNTHRSEKNTRAVYKKTLEFTADGLAVHGPQTKERFIPRERIRALDDRVLNLCWKRGKSPYTPDPIPCRLLLLYLDDVASFDALNWNCRTDGSYDMFELYSDPRCLILPYSEATMADALRLLAIASTAE